METFINNLIAKISAQRASFEKEGLSGQQLTETTRAYTDAKLSEYYTKLMAVMTESDYQAYRKALEDQDADRVQTVMGNYRNGIEKLQKELLDDF
jgi:hypothetical protein